MLQNESQLSAAMTRFWIWPGVVVLATFLCFTPVLFNDFVNWDDHSNFVGNPYYRGFTATNLQWMWTTFHNGHYQPLSWVTLGLDYQIWGLNPTGYHLTNLLLHSANALLCYLLILTLIGKIWPAAGPEREWAAALGALFFAVHPLRVEAVAWATERRDGLCTLFLLLALIGYIRARAAEQDARLSSRWKWLSLISYLLSLLSKAWGIALPLILLALDVYPLRRAENAGSWRRRWRFLVTEKTPYILLALPFAYLSAAAQKAYAMVPLEDYPLVPRFLQAGYGICFYIYKTLVPVSLSPLYVLHKKAVPEQLIFKFTLLLAIAITVSFWLARRRWRAGWCCWFCYGVVLLPVLGFTQSGPQLVADRYSYLACLPWAVLLAAALLALVQQQRGLRSLAFLRRALPLSMILIIGTLGALTFRQARVWHDSISLWNQSLRVDPENTFALRNIGSALYSEGRKDQAVRAWQECIRIAPDNAPVLHLLGQNSMTEGRPTEAIQLYRQALQAAPYFGDAHADLGAAYFHQKRAEAAVEQWRQAIESYTRELGARPWDTRILAKRGSLRLSLGEFPEAIKDLEAFLAQTLPGTPWRRGMELRLAEARRQAAATP
ncbi:MAG: tetratricopeptide repeat protein [Planctomycetota bacterium]